MSRNKNEERAKFLDDIVEISKNQVFKIHPYDAKAVMCLTGAVLNHLREIMLCGDLGLRTVCHIINGSTPRGYHAWEKKIGHGGMEEHETNLPRGKADEEDLTNNYADI